MPGEDLNSGKGNRLPLDAVVLPYLNKNDPNASATRWRAGCFVQFRKAQSDLFWQFKDYSWLAHPRWSPA